MSSPTHLLRDALHNPASQNTREVIISHLWPGVSSSAQQEATLWDAYFAYYSRECNAALIDQGRNFCARTHHDVVRIAELLRMEPNRSRVEAKMRQDLAGHRTSVEESTMLESSITVVARLVTMINLGNLPAEISGRQTLPWKQGTLSEAIHDYFEPPKDFNDDNIVLGTDFTARNFDRIAGIGVVWTDNLVDHLRLVDGDRKVCIFHHVTYLKWMEQTHSPLFPEEFLEETLETLILLFPNKDRKIKRWLESEVRMDQSSVQVDCGLLNAGYFKASHSCRRLEHFRYWRDRLGALAEAVEEATPPSRALMRALGDRKRGDGWLNSWVAVVAIGFTLFFGLVQSIEGAIQVYRAYYTAAG